MVRSQQGSSEGESLFKRPEIQFVSVLGPFFLLHLEIQMVSFKEVARCNIVLFHQQQGNLGENTKSKSQSMEILWYISGADLSSLA